MAETKKTPAKKAPAKKAPAKKAAAKKAAAKKTAGKMLKITQIGSPIGRQKYQKDTLIGLGLNKLHKTREIQDSPETRGMLKKVSHLVRVEDDAA